MSNGLLNFEITRGPVLLAQPLDMTNMKIMEDLFTGHRFLQVLESMVFPKSYTSSKPRLISPPWTAQRWVQPLYPHGSKVTVGLGIPPPPSAQENSQALGNQRSSSAMAYHGSHGGWVYFGLSLNSGLATTHYNPTTSWGILRVTHFLWTPSYTMDRFWTPRPPHPTGSNKHHNLRTAMFATAGLLNQYPRSEAATGMTNQK